MNWSIKLDGTWEFTQAGPGSKRIPQWLTATVPGTVHTDLLANQEIEDPFYRMNELDVRWVEECDWVYRRTFGVPAKVLNASRALFLDCDGLDTFATVRLNGRKVGTTDNMFHGWRFRVDRFLRPGTNTVEVEFASPWREAQRLAGRSKIQYKSMFFEPRNFIRKAQYSGGWDWGPRLMTSGIWRSVRLLGVESAEIRDLCARTVSLSQKQAVLDVEVEIEAHVAGRAAVKLDLVESGHRVGHALIRAGLRKGVQSLRSRMVVDRPRLWWPAGMGRQDLYQLSAALEVDGVAADTSECRIGLRTVELVRRKDSQGESFGFRVNGRAMFCKGANWIPGDSFLPRFTPDRYRARLTDARDANMNMLRVWGGGIYETPTFFSVCDELGILVWQDFMFSCAEYPEDKTFQARVRREAEHVIRRLRNHPSLALWCGCNENQWGFDEWWPPRPARFGAVYYDKILPAACAKFDPSRPYWPGSPYGGSRANDPSVGDRHEWSVYIFWQNPEKYHDSKARFVSEFGFQSMPAAKTVREFTASEDRHLFSRVIDHHNKCEDGHPRNMKFLAHGYGVPRDLDEYVYLSQVAQAEAIKTGVEHWRRLWPATTGGVLYWQFNDCWPVASWSGVDSQGRPKGLWYASRRFYSPVLVSLRPAGKAVYGPTDLEVWVTSDAAAERAAKLEIAAWTMNGRLLHRRRMDLRLPANGSRCLATLAYGELGLSHPDQELVHVRLLGGWETLSENTHYFSPAKYIEWLCPKLRPSVRAERGAMRIDIRSRVAVRGLDLAADRWEGRFSDNFFDLAPGQGRTVYWVPRAGLPSAHSFKRELSVRSLATR
ncbi:MAG TPA: glycoside hydrolase family 2 protein [Phycisphaerae bacterium]|nr:glycoside hydrolase family 2 protein [Phycisphaerae bacterium]HRY67661.1 glycoside hydrolase family 2 protein [Phycisphaerae bacterium]HSA25048.1 glycoside hydrolase family 2 protein [Phycisphaerae bacterium]